MSIYLLGKQFIEMAIDGGILAEGKDAFFIFLHKS